MKIRVLGCYGGYAPGMRTSSYLIDNRIAIDAGAIARSLTIEEQARISHIFVSHSHIDHLADLPFLLDNVFSLISEPVTVLGPESVIRSLKDHLFNDALWPDFSKFSNDRTAIMAMKILSPGESVRTGAVEIIPFPMDHSVECFGYVIQGPDSAVAICGDTCSTEGLAAIQDDIEGLAAVFLEASFPAGQSKIAKISKHLSTKSFAREVGKNLAGVDVHVMHLKPDSAETIGEEIVALGLDNVSLLEQDREYEF